MSRFSALVIFALSLGCTAQLEGADDEGHDFAAPLDDRENEIFQGVYDCSERGDTGYRSGDDFHIQVVTVDAKPVEVATANAYLAMQGAARAAGVNIRIVSGFRTMQEQQYFYGCYTNCNCNNCNLAARPGYSNHQSGHALDLNTSDGGVLTWLNNHGDEFGFSRTVPSEAWHWEWWGAAADFDGPCGEPQVPAGCSSGNFDGSFCDDDGAGSEEAHDCLVDLDVDFHCANVDGAPAYCGADLATRAEALFVLAGAAGLPLRDAAGADFPNAFVDDEGHRYERTLNAGKHFAVLLGDGSGHANPDGGASRSTIAVLLTRIYDLPAATQDYFSDDDGTANEDFHNRVAALGFTYGCGAGEGGRRRFCGADRADRSALARFACGAAGYDAVAVWDRPAPPPPEEPTPDEPVDPVEPDPADPIEEPIDDEAPPETEPTNELDLPPAVIHEDSCAQTKATSTSALLLGLFLFRRRRPEDGHGA
ncbi:MAG: M15 family metallopeptidase [Deltaproteobacteria bacterium]|nr:M15 family metallopeptidase [Deltaproteobacteria bacterium]